MNKGTICCPSCGHEFELSEALTGQIRDDLKGEIQADMSKREARLADKLKALKAQEEEVAKSREAVEEQVAAELKKRLAQAEKKAAKKLEGEYADQLKELQESLNEKDDSLKTLRKQEVELRKLKREAEEAKEAAELEVARTLDEERGKIRKLAEDAFAEQHRLKDVEKDKKIEGLMTALEEAQRKAQQGSMETQGEALEQDFEERLKQFFPDDEVSPVPKGVKGADLLQAVRDNFARNCGLIIWETKNTKAFSGQWIPKLKEDAIAVRANIAMLVSTVLPDGIQRFGQKDGVWVSDPASALPLAAALRQQLLAVEAERTASEGKNEKMEILYRYLAGNEFKQKVEGIVEAFTSMQEQIDRERRAMRKQWTEREKLVERVLNNTVGMYGDMQGIIGGQLPAISALELDDGGDENASAE